MPCRNLPGSGLRGDARKAVSTLAILFAAGGSSDSLEAGDSAAGGFVSTVNTDPRIALCNDVYL
ncbi:MAG: hypothetical protein ACLQGP_22755 [Isosphaeraceae bacterium]